MIAQENYEPDEEDCAWMIAQEKEQTLLRSQYHEADQKLCDYQRHTDRHLRGFNKEKKSVARTLSWRHHFDVVSDSFEVEIGDDIYDTVPWPYSEDFRSEVPRALTRKDKRREKTERRKAQRELRIWMNAGRNPAQSSVVRKTGASLPAVAA
jgi:electron transfer flavoprotein alpha subunit